MKKGKVCFWGTLLLVVIVMAGGCGNSTAAKQASTSQTSKAQSLTELIDKVKDKAKQAQGISLDFTASAPDSQTTTGKLWGQTGKMMKIETIYNGEQTVAIVNSTDNTITLYQPNLKKGMKIKKSIMSQLSYQSYEDYLNAIDPKVTKDLGTEVVNNEACRVIEYPSGSDKTMKMWLSENLDFPVRVKMTTGDGKTTQIDYMNIDFSALSGDIFNVPADIKISDQTKGN
jgi:outer membrane lipoprotein-sorting protein